MLDRDDQWQSTFALARPDTRQHASGSAEGRRGASLRYGLLVRPPYVIDLMLAANEDAQNALSEQGGVTFVRVPTGYAGSFDRAMPAEVRQRLHDDGYAARRAALERADALAA